MRLTELLSPSQILLDLEAEDCWASIVEMVDALIQRQKLPGHLREEVLDSLRAREDMLSTGVGYGVAIPHAFSANLDRVVAMFGRSRKGIDFKSQDGTPVRFVILFLVPHSAHALHLHTLSAIAKLFTNSRIRERLAEAANRSEILGILETKPARCAHIALSQRESANRL